MRQRTGCFTLCDKEERALEPATDPDLNPGHSGDCSLLHLLASVYPLCENGHKCLEGGWSKIPQKNFPAGPDTACLGLTCTHTARGAGSIPGHRTAKNKILKKMLAAKEVTEWGVICHVAGREAPHGVLAPQLQPPPDLPSSQSFDAVWRPWSRGSLWTCHAAPPPGEDPHPCPSSRTAGVSQDILADAATLSQGDPCVTPASGQTRLVGEGWPQVSPPTQTDLYP